MGLQVTRAAISAGFSPCIFLCVVYDAEMVRCMSLASFLNFYLFILATLHLSGSPLMCTDFLWLQRMGATLVAVLGLAIAMASAVAERSL